MRVRDIINKSPLREYFIEEVNNRLFKAITILGNRYPEPSYDNVWHPNSIRMLDWLVEYRKHELNNHRQVIVESGMRIVINKYEHSRNWRDIIDFFAECLILSEWKRIKPTRQVYDWRW